MLAIKEIPKDKAESIIKTCAKIAGIGCSFDSSDFLIIGQFLKNHFPRIKSNEISEAFQLYAAGKLYEIIKGKESPIEHYGNFSPKFIGSVLKAYREYKNKENLKVKINFQPKLMLENIVNIKDEQKKAFEFIENVYKENGEFPIIANWSDAFIYAEENKIIQLSKEEKQQIKNKVQGRLKAIKSKEKIERGAFKIRNFTSHDIKIESRKEALMTYLKNNFV